MRSKYDTEASRHGVNIKNYLLLNQSVVFDKRKVFKIEALHLKLSRIMPVTECEYQNTGYTRRKWGSMLLPYHSEALPLHKATQKYGLDCRSK